MVVFLKVVACFIVFFKLLLMTFHTMLFYRMVLIVAMMLSLLRRRIVFRVTIPITIKAVSVISIVTGIIKVTIISFVPNGTITTRNSSRRRLIA